VHALVDRPKAGKQVPRFAQYTLPDVDVRVVDADVDVRMRGEQQQRFVLRVDQEVVDEYPHAHVPFGCRQQLLGGEYADVVGAPDKILNVYRARCVPGQPGPADQRFLALLEDVGAGIPRYARSAVRAVGIQPLSYSLRAGRAGDKQQRDYPAERDKESGCGRRPQSLSFRE